MNTMTASKVFFTSFAFFAANLLVFVPSSIHFLENVRVATPSLTSPSVLYLLVAQKEGHFKDAGLNVEINTCATSSPPRLLPSARSISFCSLSNLLAKHRQLKH
jgi:ABC-type nitrate/sulfonate/bicarbonate transport system substrate-binding protein